jgi:hypothetical protein
MPVRFKGRCFFCDGAGPLTDEHIISRTVREQFPLSTGVRRVFGDHTSREYPQLIVVLKDAVCDTCNNRWMSQLETSFVHLLGRQLTDRSAAVILDLAQQELVATWAAKVALLLCAYIDATRNEMYIPIADLRWLAEHSSPPALTRVWLGALETKNKLMHFAEGIPMGRNPPGKFGFAAIVTFSIGSLLFQVSVRDPELSEEERAARPPGPLIPLDPPPYFQQGLVRIWPWQGHRSVRWPPPKVFRADAALALSRYMMTLQPVLAHSQNLTPSPGVEPGAAMDPSVQQMVAKVFKPPPLPPVPPELL